MVRDSLTEREREERRKQAVEVLERGYDSEEVAEIFDVGARTVRRWNRIYEDEGIEGLGATRRANRGFTYLENISVNHLWEVLEKIEEGKAAKRIMAGITYKNREELSEDSSLTKKEIADFYNITTQTLRKWLQNLEQLENKPFREVVYDDYSQAHCRSLPEEKFPELEDILLDGPESYGFADPLWTGSRVAAILKSEFDISVSVSTATKYLRELGWSSRTSDYVARKSNPKKAHKRSLTNTDKSELKSKLSDFIGQPSQRLMAAILYKEGFSGPMISDWFDISQGAIYNWFESIENEPLREALYDEPTPGRPPDLPEEKHSELEEILKQGPETYGFTGQIWTGERVARVIEKELDVSISGSTAVQYMKKIGWSYQKPQTHKAERDEELITNFLTEKWFDIRNKAKEANQAIVFIDETKFRLLPTIRGTWAPVGETPVVEVSGLFEFVAVIGALVYIPKKSSFNFQWRKQRCNFETESIKSFLTDMVKNISHEPILLLDNWSPHNSAISEIENILEDIAISPHTEWFPEYSSNLNPVDNVWGHAKYNELPNYAPKDLDELEQKVEETLSEIQDDDSVLRYCIKDAGLEIEA